MGNTILILEDGETLFDTVGNIDGGTRRGVVFALFVRHALAVDDFPQRGRIGGASADWGKQQRKQQQRRASAGLEFRSRQ